MYFESVNGLLNMAGHGIYVWSCYGLFFALVGINVWHARSQKMKALKRAQAMVRRNQ